VEEVKVPTKVLISLAVCLTCILGMARISLVYVRRFVREQKIYNDSIIRRLKVKFLRFGIGMGGLIALAIIIFFLDEII
jgi:hypothetical protein